MSATTESTPLGGFEQRLLTQLRAQIAAQPTQPATTQPARARPHRRSPRARALPRIPGLTRGLTLPAAAAIAALSTALLTLLPAATPTLAQAFPILAGRTQALPARLARVLRAQWQNGASSHFDLRHAYAFRTAAGTGYVVLDRRHRWLCLLVPGLSANNAGGRCERVTLARLGQPPLSLRISGAEHRQEIVALLPRGADASSHSAGQAAKRLTLDRGVLEVLTRGPVTITTTAPTGHRTSVTYTP